MEKEKLSIAIISASVRRERKSHRVALYFQRELNEHFNADAEILDLMEYDFPIFHERLKFQENPDPKAVEFAKKIHEADGVIIVTPEYNGGYPASLKNVFDLLVGEWHRKPVAISTVSDGSFGGNQVLMSLQFSLWKITALAVTARFPVPTVHEMFDENGVAFEEELIRKRSNHFIKELMWFIKASKIS